MAKLKWIPNAPNLARRAEVIMRDLIDRADGPDVAGRARYERANFRLLSQFVGTGEVRRQFGLAK